MAHYFLAVPLPEEVKSSLQQSAPEFKAKLNYGYWTAEADYHITLFFMGEVKPDQLTLLKQTLHTKTKDTPGTRLQLNGFGTFGKKEQPRVLWMGVKADQNLAALQSIVQSCTVACGFEAEKRPYRPHITLAKKWRGGALAKDEWQDICPSYPSLSWTADEFVLFQVQPEKTPRYMPVERFPLI